MSDAAVVDALSSNTHKWEFHDADTRYLTHAIHRYSGKFIPQIARQAIELLTNPGDVVLDPYAGSGTCLLEAMMAGRRAIGVDLNPLAVLISTVKVTPIEPSALADLWRRATAIRFASEADQLDVWGYAEERALAGSVLEDPYFSKWFPQDVLASLNAIKLFADGLDDRRLRAVTLVAMSDILRKVSRAHQGFPNVMFDKHRDVNASVQKEFLGRLKEIIDAVTDLYDATASFAHLIEPSVILGRAEDSHVAEGSVDAVITHPPYIGSVPYAEYGQLSLKWLGADPKDLDSRLTGGRRQSRDVVSRFRDSYEGMLKASVTAIKPDGNIFLLTGNPTVKGEVVDLVQMTTDIAERIGLRLRYTADRVGINRRANKMNVETVTVWTNS